MGSKVLDDKSRALGVMLEVGCAPIAISIALLSLYLSLTGVGLRDGKRENKGMGLWCVKWK